MATQTYSVVADRDNCSRVNTKKGQGLSLWLPIGRDTHGNIHRVYVHFPIVWTGIGKIISSELRLHSTGEHNFSFGATPRIQIGRYTNQNWTEGSGDDGDWLASAWRRTGSVKDDGIHAAYTPGENEPDTPSTTKEHTFSFDVTPIVEVWAPSSVRRRNDKPGGGAINNGFELWGATENHPGARWEVYARHTGVPTAKRPTLLITYEVGSAPPDPPTLVGPSGSVGPNEKFTGTFSSPQTVPASDTLGKVEIRLWNAAGSTLLWSQIFTVSEDQRLAATFEVPFPASVKSLTDYQWDARVADQSGVWSGWAAAKMAFRVNNTAPVVTTIAPPASVSTLLNFKFQATYSDADGDALKAFRLQLRTVTLDTDPTWGDSLLWDSDLVAPTEPNKIALEYGGTGLVAGTYSWRVQAMDKRGALSAWAYRNIVLAEDYEPEGGGDMMTGWSREQRQYRLVLRAVGTDRGPGTIVGIITDMANLGAAIYANSPGEAFWTLPVDHPQISVCEPWQTHYAIEQYIGDRWIEKFTGIVDDFDTTADEIVFHGRDYLSLLATTVDERYDAANPNKATPDGSKIVDQTISAAIADQIDTGKTQAEAWYKFIGRATGAGKWDTLAERVTLLTTFNEHLSTITGLMDSHKQGAINRMTRLFPKHEADGTWKWHLVDNYGQDRPNIRLEPGGLVNGWRIIAYGDFGTMAHGIGRIRDQLKVYYEKAESPTNDGVRTATQVWGRISKAAVWQDLYDTNDLKRRVQELAMKAGKVGKRVAIAITTGTLGPLDGYDIYDSIPVNIQRFDIDTTKFGSGWWTIYGVAVKLYPDGHDDLTLTLLPKQDASPVNPDILAPSVPILGSSDWDIHFRPPQPEDSGLFWIDRFTGIMYHWNADTSTWDEWSTADLAAAPGEITVTSRVVIDPSGHSVPIATFTVPKSMRRIHFGWTFIFDPITGVPLWTDPINHGTAADGSFALDVAGIPPGTPLAVTAWTEDDNGGSLASTVVTHTTIQDTKAPPIPKSTTTTPIINGVVFSWDPTVTPAKDLAFYEIRYAVDDGSGTGVGGTPEWTYLRSKTIAVVASGLDPDPDDDNVAEGRYWFQVRAIDTSGNVEDDTDPENPVSVFYTSEPEKGWTTLISGDPRLAGGVDVEADSLNSTHISALIADKIKAGKIWVDTSNPDYTDGIWVYDGATLIGYWNETGIYLFDPADATNYLQLINGGLTVYKAGVPVTAITPEGINASAITSGAVPGGGNLVLNSSFELVDFSVPATVLWDDDVQANWNADRVGSDTNVTTNAGNLTMTGVSY